MPARTTLIAAAIALLAGASPAAAGIALDACAMRAASPYEPGFEEVGVIDIVDAQLAVAACQKAQAAEPGPQASAWLARALFAAGNYDDALALAQSAGKAGNVIGLDVAGSILIEGYSSTGKDEAAALKLLEQAALAGYPPSQTSYGYAYDAGQGVDADLAKAFDFYMRAAKQGFGVAETNVGIYYRDGLGPAKQDYEKAFAWFLKAAEHNNASGQDSVGYAYEYGQGVAQDYEKAVKYYKLAADQGDSNAMGNLAYSYEYGQGLAQDYAKAMELYRKALDAGSEWTAAYIGHLYLDGLGVNRDLNEAKRWIHDGIVAEDSYAMFLMGRISEEGLGTAVDLKAARDWYQKGADAGDDDAKTALERLAGKKKV